ncbi:hypothetical protein ACWKWU_15935 [Chitinophaga lutea]
MKRFWLPALLLMAQTAFAQKPAGVYPGKDFQYQLSVADWMTAYDSAAWRMSEYASGLSWEEVGRMGKEWFCYKDKDSLWNGIYGKFKDSTYDLVIQYRIAANDTIELVCDEPDTAMLHSVSRAIRLAYKEAGLTLGKSYVKFNKFIRRHNDNTISIWLLPSIQPNEIAMYGGEFYYTFDEKGTTITGRSEYYQGSFKGVRLGGKPRDLVLRYEDSNELTQGAIFFARQYRSFFTSVRILTHASASLLAFNQTKGYYWQHGDNVKAIP